jgi:hypothetical protein
MPLIFANFADEVEMVKLKGKQKIVAFFKR